MRTIHNEAELNVENSICVEYNLSLSGSQKGYRDAMQSLWHGAV